MLLASWRVRKEFLLKKCEHPFAASEDLRQEERKAFEAVEKIADEIAKLSKPRFFLLRKEFDISQTTIAEWLDRDEILRDSWTETVFDRRRVKREIPQAKTVLQEVTAFEDIPAVPEQIQNLKRFSRNASKDNPSWDEKRLRQYRRELKKQIRGLLALPKEQSRKPTPQTPAKPEPQHEIVVENIAGTEHEIKLCGEDVFIPGDIIGYKDYD